MIESWRVLLYPLGFLSTFAFGGRALSQWLSSELQGRSVVTRKFWWLSLIGNLLLAFHALLQVQFHVCFIQACNSVISWRNLNLMKEKNGRSSLSFTLWLLFFSATLTVGVFALQDFFLYQGEGSWFRIPTIPGIKSVVEPVHPLLHAVGALGMTLFALRFWVQWWQAEKAEKSDLGSLFWWVSLIGAFLSILYFAKIQDPVNLIGPTFGMLPYIRNLMLIRKAEKRQA